MSRTKLNGKLLVRILQPIEPVGLVRETTKEGAALALRQATPHTEGGVRIESISETFEANAA